MRRRSYYTVSAAYPVVGEMGIDWELDRVLGIAARRKHTAGSGSGFGARDLEWEYRTRGEALAVARRLESLNLTNGLHVVVLKWPRESVEDPTRIEHRARIVCAQHVWHVWRAAGAL